LLCQLSYAPLFTAHYWGSVRLAGGENCEPTPLLYTCDSAHTSIDAISTVERCPSITTIPLSVT